MPAASATAYDFAPELASASRLAPINPWKAAADSPSGGFSFPMSSIGYPTNPAQPYSGTVNNEFYNWTQSGLCYYFNPDVIGPAVYEEMVTTDASCYAAMEFLVLATLAKFGPFMHPKPVIQDTVNKWLANLITPWMEVLKEQLTAVWAGYSTGEIVAEDWVPTMIQGLHPSTLSYDLWLSGPKKNLLRAARQWRFGTFQSYLPSDKIIHYAHGKRWGNVYGYSRMRAAWIYWFLKAKMLAEQALALKNYASPHTTGKVTGGYETMEYPQGSGRQVNVLDFITEQLKQLQANGVLAHNENVEIDIRQAATSVGKDYGDAIEYYDMMIFRAALIPSLVGQHGSSGSYALGRNHYDLFVLMLEEQAGHLSNINVDQFIKPFIIAHWGVQDTYGQFSIEDFKQDDEKLLFEAFLDGVNAGIIKPGLAKDLNKMRERTGFSPLSQAEIDSQPIIQANPSKKIPVEPEGELDPRHQGGPPPSLAPDAAGSPKIHAFSSSSSLWPTRPLTRGMRRTQSGLILV